MARVRYIKYKRFILMSFVYLEFPYPIQTDNVKFLPLWKSYTFSISSLKCPQPNSIVIYIAPLIFFAPTKFSLCSLWIPYPYSTGFWEWQRSFSRTSDKKKIKSALFKGKIHEITLFWATIKVDKKIWWIDIFPSD